MTEIGTNTLESASGVGRFTVIGIFGQAEANDAGATLAADIQQLGCKVAKRK